MILVVQCMTVITLDPYSFKGIFSPLGAPINMFNVVKSLVLSLVCFISFIKYSCIVHICEFHFLHHFLE